MGQVSDDQQPTDRFETCSALLRLLSFLLPFFFSVRSLASLPMMMEPIEFTCTADDQAGQKRLGGRRKRRNTARPRSSPVDIYGCAPGTRLNWSALPPLARYLLLMTTALDGNDPQVKRGTSKQMDNCATRRVPSDLVVSLTGREILP